MKKPTKEIIKIVLLVVLIWTTLVVLIVSISHDVCRLIDDNKEEIIENSVQIVIEKDPEILEMAKSDIIFYGNTVTEPFMHVQCTDNNILWKDEIVVEADPDVFEFCYVLNRAASF